MFDLYVQSNFSEDFDFYIKKKNHIPCYFCDYLSRSQVLKNIKNEIATHMETNHEDIIEMFKSDNTEVENVYHLEFLDFYASATKHLGIGLWSVGW